jgi:predicted TIM-barrel fold metal-dependent hydrolase
MDAQIPIFDVDTHFTEPHDLWTSRAPRKYKDQVLRVRRNDGYDSWCVGDTQLGLIGTTVINRDMEKVFGVVTLPSLDQAARAGTYAPERLAYMDDAGVGAQLVYPNVIGFGGQALMSISDDAELRLFHVHAYNDAIFDLQKESGGRILPQAALPLWDLDASLVEIDRIRNMGLTGIAMSSAPGHFGQPSLAHPKWERFFDTCQDLELPINFHVGSGTWVGDFEKWWGPHRTVYQEDGTLNSTALIFFSSLLTNNNIADVLNLLLTGMLDRYPKLKFVSVESGCGWVPGLIQALEYNWKEMLTDKDRAGFKRTPKQMFMEQIYCSYWFDNRTSVDAFIKDFGPDNLLFETDFPHPTSLYPNNLIVEKVEETLSHHPREVQEKVLYRNAEKLYGTKIQQPKRVAVN